MRFVLVLLALAAIPLASAQFYADVTFDVQSDGTVHVFGTSNHPLFEQRTTQEFTDKTRERWTFNLGVQDVLDDFVITIMLPPGATLEGVSAKANVDITSNGDRVVITRVGSGSAISLVVQYTITADGAPDRTWLVVAAATLVVGLAAGYTQAVRRRRKNRGFSKELREQKQIEAGLAVETSISDLPVRQQDIIKLLQATKKPLTQKQVQEALRIPKASASRNINSLFRRGLIKKEQSGMTNTIWLAEHVPEKPLR